MDHGDFEDLLRGTTSDKVLCDKAINIAKSSKYDEYQRGLVLMVYKCFDKKSSSANASATRTRSETLATQNKFEGGGIKNENISNQAKELHKPITRKLKKKKSPLFFYRQYLWY